MQARPLLQLIENQAVGIFGNLVAVPILEQGRWELYARISDDETVDERLVTLPTRGLYAETLLSKCNEREIRDVKRMYDPEERCPGEAPAITGIAPGSRRSDRDLQPTQMPSPVLQPQSAPQAPAPEGLASALQAIAAGDMLRDMSRGGETVRAAQTLASRAMEQSGEAQQASLSALNDLLGSSGGGFGATGGIGGGQTGATGGSGDGANRANTAAGIAAGADVRGSDPKDTSDQLQNVREARERCDIDAPTAESAAGNILGATPKVEKASYDPERTAHQLDRGTAELIVERYRRARN